MCLFFYFSIFCSTILNFFNQSKSINTFSGVAIFTGEGSVGTGTDAGAAGARAWSDGVVCTLISFPASGTVEEVELEIVV